MVIRLFNLFCLFFLILQATANPNLTGAAPTTFVPDFSGQAFTVPQGTIVTPLCANPADVSCISQWGHQAIPLSIQQQLGSNQYQYFLPVFTLSQILSEDPMNSDNWIPYTPSFKGYSSGRGELQRTPVRRRRKGGKSSSRTARKKETSEEEREQEEPDKKKKTPEQEGTEVEGKSKKVSKSEDKVPEKKPEQIPPPQALKTEKPSQTRSIQAPQEEDEPVYYINKKDPSKVAIVNVDSSGKVTATGGKVAFISSEVLEEVVVPDSTPSLPVSDPQQKELSPGKTPKPDRGPDPPLDERTKPPSDGVQGKTPQGRKTQLPPDDGMRKPPLERKGAKPSSDRTQSPPGQIQGRSPSIGKTQPPSGDSTQSTAKTPLYRVKQDTIALPATIKEIQPGCFVINKPESKTEGGYCFECDIIKEKGSRESEIIGFFKSASDRVKTKIHNNTYTHGKDIETKICSPENSLKAVIGGDNKIGNFKRTCKKDFSDFFSQNYCEVCKKGIPPAVTFALMTIESSGKCKSVGTSGHNEESVGLFQINQNTHQCTPNHERGTPENAKCLMKIDNNFQASINILIEKYNYLNQPNVQTHGKCKSWLKIPDHEREAWRRAVSGYNSGEGHVKQVLDDIAEKEPKYTKPIIWEELRAFYFKYPGRRAKKHVKWNLAYTEAILGREVSSNVYGGRGAVEIWEQYIEKKRKEKKLPSCSK